MFRLGVVSLQIVIWTILLHATPGVSPSMDEAAFSIDEDLTHGPQPVFVEPVICRQVKNSRVGGYPWMEARAYREK